MRFGPLPEAIKSRQYQSLFRAQNLTYSGDAHTIVTILLIGVMIADIIWSVTLALIALDQ